MQLREAWFLPAGTTIQPPIAGHHYRRQDPVDGSDLAVEPPPLRESSIIQSSGAMSPSWSGSFR